MVRFSASAAFGNRFLKPAAYDIFRRGARTRTLFQDARMHLSSLGLCVGQGCALLSGSQHARLYAEEPCVATLCPCGDPEIVTYAILQEIRRGTSGQSFVSGFDPSSLGLQIEDLPPKGYLPLCGLKLVLF